MTVKRTKRNTYRFTPELERNITQGAKKMGISKNAFVQITLARALKIDSSSPTSIAKEIEQKKLSKTGTDRS